jgi:hypothetical protein
MIVTVHWLCAEEADGATGRHFGQEPAVAIRLFTEIERECRDRQLVPAHFQAPAEEIALAQIAHWGLEMVKKWFQEGPGI